MRFAQILGGLKLSEVYIKCSVLISRVAWRLLVV
jgi:hypothetical protein